MPQVKSQFNFLKILFLIIGILIISLFINSCSLLNGYTRDFEVTNKIYLSDDNEYILRFYSDNGSLKNKTTNNTVTFDYTYDSGIVLGIYTEELITEDNQVEVIRDYILYSQNLNKLFKLI